MADRDENVVEAIAEVLGPGGEMLTHDWDVARNIYDAAIEAGMRPQKETESLIMKHAEYIGCLRPVMPFAQGPNPSDELAPCGTCPLCFAHKRIEELERWVYPSEPYPGCLGDQVEELRSGIRELAESEDEVLVETRAALRDLLGEATGG